MHPPSLFAKFDSISRIPGATYDQRRSIGGHAQAQDPYPAPANCESAYLLKSDCCL